MRIKDKTAGVKATFYARSPWRIVRNERGTVGVKLTHYAQFSRGGCVTSRFDPGFSLRSKVHAAYPKIDFRGPVEKMAINLTYDKYKFFSVETDARIIK